MKIHWAAKWLSIPYEVGTIMIQGIISELNEGAIVQICQLSEEDLHLDTNDESVSNQVVSPEIQLLLTVYAYIFATKVQYPPPRSCNHSIPLIPGVRPISVRPYRYASTLKDEIESQVKDMLQAGLIQHNTSAFSSPVLLVKKKDKSYRLCIDY
jgi:hypothetical protein